jgi:2-phospho-L-lactate guanylyltransferase
MIILVPFKGLSAGKSRLSPCLDAPRRRALCEYFLARTLQLALAVTSPDRVRLVTSDGQAAAIGVTCSVQAFPDSKSGLNPALDNARQELEMKSSDRLMILPVDLPYATLDALHVAIEDRADVVISSDQEGRGTNLLILSERARRLPLSFGPESFHAHSTSARAAGLGLHVIEDLRISRDIDEPEDYLAWKKSESFPHQVFKEESGRL